MTTAANDNAEIATAANTEIVRLWIGATGLAKTALRGYGAEADYRLANTDLSTDDSRIRASNSLHGAREIVRIYGARR